MEFIQYGGALPINDQLLFYRPNIKRQHGYGIGSFLGSLFQKLIPFARQHVIPYVLPHAKSAIKNVVTDAIAGESIKSSLKKNTMQALKGSVKDALNQSGGVRTRRRRRTKHKGMNKRKKISKRKKRGGNKVGGGRGGRKNKKSKRVTKKLKTRRKRKRPLTKRDLLSVFD